MEMAVTDQVATPNRPKIAPKVIMVATVMILIIAMFIAIQNGNELKQAKSAIKSLKEQRAANAPVDVEVATLKSKLAEREANHNQLRERYDTLVRENANHLQAIRDLMATQDPRRPAGSTGNVARPSGSPRVIDLDPVGPLKSDLPRDPTMEVIGNGATASLTSEQQRIVSKDAICEVVGFNEDWNVIEINGGSDQGLQPGIRLAIRQGFQIVGDLIIGEVQAESATGSLDLKTRRPGSPAPRPGDSCLNYPLY